MERTTAACATTRALRRSARPRRSSFERGLAWRGRACASTEPMEASAGPRLTRPRDGAPTAVDRTPPIEGKIILPVARGRLLDGFGRPTHRFSGCGCTGEGTTRQRMRPVGITDSVRVGSASMVHEEGRCIAVSSILRMARHPLRSQSANSWQKLPGHAGGALR